MAYNLHFFPLQNAVYFIIVTYLVPVLFIFYIQGVLKFKKNNSGAKTLMQIFTKSHHSLSRSPELSGFLKLWFLVKNLSG